MSPTPHGKQSGKNKRPVNVMFPGAIYWRNNTYYRVTPTGEKTPKIVHTSMCHEGKQNLPAGTDVCTFWGDEVNLYTSYQ